MSDYTEENLFANDGLFRIAAIGVEAAQFFASRVGRYVIEQAEAEIDQAYKVLADVDPEDPKAIRDLQFKISVARAAPQWLNAAIHNGSLSEDQIALEESHEGGY